MFPWVNPWTGESTMGNPSLAGFWHPAGVYSQLPQLLKIGVPHFRACSEQHTWHMTWLILESPIFGSLYSCLRQHWKWLVQLFARFFSQLGDSAISLPNGCFILTDWKLEFGSAHGCFNWHYHLWFSGVQSGNKSCHRNAHANRMDYIHDISTTTLSSNMARKSICLL